MIELANLEDLEKVEYLPEKINIITRVNTLHKHICWMEKSYVQSAYVTNWE